MNNSSKQKHSAKDARKKLFARILAFLLALLMVGGTAYYFIYMLIISASATETTTDVNTNTLADDLNLRVGLKYGTGVPNSFQTTTSDGYTIGIQPLTDGVFNYTPFWQITATAVTVAADANLTHSGTDYLPTSMTANVSVGGYHVEFLTEYAIENAMVLQQQINTVNAMFYGSGYYAFPAYVNGVLRIRVGAFSTREAADAAFSGIASFMPGYSAQVVAPSSTGVVVLDSSTDQILFSYDDSGRTTLGLAAISSGNATVYTKTANGNVYDGVFSYYRYTKDDVTGIAVTNVLTLDQYVGGVLPYEISASWPIETLKANAIAARSFAARYIGRHESAYSFDICNYSGCCQSYLGAGRANEAINKAIQSTHGLIITYNGKLASANYCSSFGGYRLSAEDVWGGSSYEYLQAKATPWEHYTEHRGGFWTVEVSPTELLEYLVNDRGYSELAGGGYITDIEVLAYASGSPYVKTMRITAANGKSITVTTTSKVQSCLLKYLKSANFVVGKGSVNYTKDTVEILGDRVIDMAVVKDVLGPANGSATEKTTEGVISVGVQVSVLTALTKIATALQGTQVLTAGGYMTLDADTVFVLTANNAAAFATGNIGLPQTETIAVPRTIKEYTVHTETLTATASSPNNFIFVGKGYGHGIGLSQFGSYDLGKLGYDYSQIINTYYPGVSIVFYRELEQFKNR